jgi:TP901 family phage tail tape measure protein
VAAAGRAAVPRKELLGFAEDAAKMGVAFDSTAEEAGTTMAKWRTAFELPQSGVVALADQINALTNSFGGDVGAVTWSRGSARWARSAGWPPRRSRR